MKICALTMVYKDYWALSQWYTHYGRQVGFDNLFVVAHGADDQIAKICPQASVITVPRDTFEGFDRRRGQLLNSFSDGLALSYDWVIRTDADELICFDPSRYGGLEDVFAGVTSKAIFALGLNVAEVMNDKVLGEGQMALGHRTTAVFTGHYSKAWAGKRGTALWRHGIWVGARRLPTAHFEMPEGVYLVHLKYANLAALELANQHRTEVGNAPGRGLPGAAWKEADRDASRFYTNLAAYEAKQWADARDTAFASIVADPVRDEKESVLRSKSKTFKYRVTLPGWFKTQFGADCE